MSDKIFVDTNILVYSYDRSEPEKQRQAVRLLEQLVASGQGVISVQVLAEFWVAVTRKIAAPLSIPEAYERLKNHLQIWTVLDVTGMVVLEAARGVQTYRFNYWDAQIWATARLNQIPVILSEDFNPDSVIEGVHFVNPFSPSFHLETWTA